MSGLEPTAVLEAADPTGRGVRIEFIQQGNRFTHRIVGFDAAGSSATLLEAIEDSLQEKWPCSPVLQGINLDDLRRNAADSSNSQQAAMLIGTAGDGHWSLVARPESTDAGQGIVFEPACRVKSLPPRLSSRYRVGPDLNISQSGSGVQLSSFLGDFAVGPLPLASDGAQDSCCLEIQKDHLLLSTEVDWDSAPPVTLQWRYGVRVR